MNPTKASTLLNEDVVVGAEALVSMATGGRAQLRATRARRATRRLARCGRVVEFDEQHVA